jgi:peptide/nickel transport system substrate-binding protein
MPIPSPKFAALILIALAAACTRTPSTDAGSAAVGTPVSGGTLTWGVESEPTTLNPQINGQDKTTLLFRNSYESLLTRDEQGGFQPWLASAWDVSADGLTYTFTLRADVKFSDGSALDAATVVRNFTQLQRPDYVAGTAHGAYVTLLQSIDAIDAHTLRITLKQPYSPFLALAGKLPLLAASAFDSPELKAGGPALAGTGPFVLKRYQPGQQIEFERNPDYRWAPASAKHQGPAYLDKLEYRFLPESSVRVGALLSGQVDVIEGVPGQDAATIEASPEFSYQHALNPGTPFSLFFNVKRAPTDDVQVRRALVEGLEIDTLVQSIYRGQRTHAWGITSPIDPFYDASIEKSYGNQPAQANALLDAAGWQQRDGEGFRTRDGKRLSIALLDTPALLRDQREVLLLAIQAQARQRLGVELRFEQIDMGSYLTRAIGGDYGALSNSNAVPDGVDIENHYLPLSDGGVINLSRTEAPQLQQWLHAAAATRDDAERKRLYAQVQQFALRQEYLTLPLYQPEDQVVSAARVHGLGFRAFYRLPENAYDVWIAR